MAVVTQKAKEIIKIDQILTCSRFEKTRTCCGADEHVDPANDLSLSVRVITAKDNEGNKGE